MVNLGPDHYRHAISRVIRPSDYLLLARQIRASGMTVSMKRDLETEALSALDDYLAGPMGRGVHMQSVVESAQSRAQEPGVLLLLAVAEQGQWLVHEVGLRGGRSALAIAGNVHEGGLGPEVSFKGHPERTWKTSISGAVKVPEVRLLSPDRQEIVAWVGLPERIEYFRTMADADHIEVQAAGALDKVLAYLAPR